MSFMPKGPGGGRDRNQKNRISAGAIVEYEQHGKPVLAVVDKPLKKKWLVIDEFTKEVALSAERIYLLPARLPSTSWPVGQKVRFIKQLASKALKKAESLEIADIWKQIVENKELSKRAQPVSELTKAIFKSDQIVQHLALRRAFLNDSIYFNRRGQNFEPRSEQDIERMQAKAKLEAEKIQEVDILIAAIKEKHSDNSLELPKSIKYLEDMAVWGSKHASAATAKKVLNSCKEQLSLELTGNPAEQALSLLQQIGHFKQEQNLSLVRHRIETVYSEEIEAEATRVLALDRTEGRKDLSDYLTISIDGSETEDIDDALSLRKVNGKIEIGIHISDVSSAIECGSILDQLAMRKGSSIYCPEDSYHMLPPSLSKAGLSLICKEKRPAISHMIILDEAGNIESSELIQSIVQVDANLSYDEANSALCDDDQTKGPEITQLLNEIWQLAAKREGFRIESGATHFERRDLAPKADSNGKLNLVPVADDSPAFKLVGEMMILANQCAALFAKTNSFPLVFRSQGQPENNIDEEAQKVPNGPAREYFMRGQLKRSEISTNPAEHFGLGISEYAQVTSPIRRTVDLLNQRQIVSFLSEGSVKYSAEELEKKLTELEGPLERANMVQNERNRYWLIKYLEQEQIKELEGTIVKFSGPKPLAELTLTQTTSSFKQIGKADKTRLGSKVTLGIAQLNATRGVLRLEEIKKSG